MRTRLLFMVLAVVGWCGVWTTPSEAFFTDFHSAPTSCQGDTESFGSWDVIFAGLGCVNKETDDEADPQHKVFLHLQPQTSTAADEHHAALVCGPRLRPYVYRRKYQLLLYGGHEYHRSDAAKF
jgi:hypothetical protein